MTMEEQSPPTKRPDLRRERTRLLHHVAALLDRPMTVLAFVWLGLLVLDLTRGLSGWLATLNTVLWTLFVAHFLLEFTIAPEKGRYLKKNWLTAVALLLPALRVLRVFRAFRVLRAARAVRSTGLVRVLTSLNRAMRAARKSLRRRWFGYVAVLTFAGAAGMFAFENPAALRDEGHTALADQGGGLTTYGEAVWWTAMTMTTMGPDYFPKTPEGRLLGWLLAVFAFAVFGYITATIASYFVVRDRASDHGQERAAALADEVARLRAEVEALTRTLRSRADG